MDRHADLRRGVAIAAQRHHALDEIDRLLRNGERTPAQLRRRGVDIVERRAADEPVVNARVGLMHDRWAGSGRSRCAGSRHARWVNEVPEINSA